MDDLIRYRFSSADEKLTSAKVLLDAGLYKDSVGRSYYAIFVAVRAVLASRQVDFSKHAGVIAYLQKEFIKTGILAVIENTLKSRGVNSNIIYFDTLDYRVVYVCFCYNIDNFFLLLML